MLPQGMESETVSTAAQAIPSWKQELNRRLAEHKGRRPGAPAAPETHAESAQAASRRAREAAARVAARYANQPSFSEMLTMEAHAAIQAAEAASQAAMRATAAAHSVLKGIQAASATLPALHKTAPQPVLVAPAPAAQPREMVPEEAPRAELSAHVEPAPVPPAAEVSIRWNEELPSRPAEPVETRAALGRDLFEDEWWKLASVEPEDRVAEPQGADEIEMVEPAKPISGNLIEFPRELVAARKARPRLAEGPNSAPEAQLSIFEVDPGALPAQPVVETMDAAADAPAAPAWSGIELDAPHHEEAPVAAAEPAAAPQAASAIEPAPASRRAMAVIVDGALIVGSLMASCLAAAVNAPVLPGVRSIEIGGAAALMVFTAAYLALFFTLGHATPGMRYAGIELRAFNAHRTTRAQRCARLIAMLISVLPAGLGVLWSLFDDEHLCWHDRLSGTYLARA